jgi:hypothetical protein
MEKNLDRAMKLARMTGDRLIIYDRQSPDSSYVVMSIDEYEKIAKKGRQVANLTEEELLDKINRDIAVWKSQQESDKKSKNYLKISDDPGLDDDFCGDEDEEDFYEADDYDDEEESGDLIDELEFTTKPENRKRKNAWRIPSDRRQAAEEVIEEDRQYLEEVEQ